MHAFSVLHSLMDLLRDILNVFSPQRTFVELVRSDHLEMQFPIFNILKLGASFALYVCLKYIMIGHLPIINRDRLVRALDQPLSILFRSPMIYMDGLLLISGFLVAYQLAEEIEQKTRIQLLKRMALKISRYIINRGHHYPVLINIYNMKSLILYSYHFSAIYQLCMWCCSSKHMFFHDLAPVRFG